MSADARGLNRREAIRRLVGAGLVTASTADLADAFLAVGRSHADAPGVTSYRPRFLTDGEYETVGRLVSLIIPSDETPGAREARVEEWIDFLVSESDQTRQRLYRDGLARLARLCRERRGNEFRRLPEAIQEAILRETSEADPTFFRALKDDTVFGFYTSEIGLKELRWDGQTFHSECPGCDHPAHLNWVPGTALVRTFHD
jgi:gluconate 2-dehydrogenase gamma chain